MAARPTVPLPAQARKIPTAYRALDAHFSPRLLRTARRRQLYHNVASRRPRLKTSQEVGIKGVNTDQLYRRLSSIEVGGFSSPLLGFSASRTGSRRDDDQHTSIVTKLFGNTRSKSGRVARNRDFLLQLQDAGGVRGRFGFGSQGTGSRPRRRKGGDAAANSAPANAFAAFLLDLPNNVSRDSESLTTRHAPLRSSLHQRQMAGDAEAHTRSGAAPRILKPIRRVGRTGRLVEFDPATNTVRVAGFATYRMMWA